jgi:hypothetical protein
MHHYTQLVFWGGISLTFCQAGLHQDPPDLCLPYSWDYRYAPLCLVMSASLSPVGGLEYHISNFLSGNREEKRRAGFPGQSICHRSILINLSPPNFPTPSSHHFPLVGTPVCRTFQSFLDTLSHPWLCSHSHSLPDTFAISAQQNLLTFESLGRAGPLH